MRRSARHCSRYLKISRDDTSSVIFIRRACQGCILISTLQVNGFFKNPSKKGSLNEEKKKKKKRISGEKQSFRLAAVLTIRMIDDTVPLIYIVINKLFFSGLNNTLTVNKYTSRSQTGRY